MNNGAKQASLGCNRASLPPQHSLFYHTTVAVLEGKRDFSYILCDQHRSKIPQKQQNKSLKPIFIL